MIEVMVGYSLSFIQSIADFLVSDVPLIFLVLVLLNFVVVIFKSFIS